MENDTTKIVKKKKSYATWIIIIVLEIAWIPIAYYWSDIVHTAFVFDFPVAVEDAKKSPINKPELSEPINQVLVKMRDIHLSKEKGEVSIDLFFSLVSGNLPVEIENYLKQRKVFTLKANGDTSGAFSNLYKEKEFVIKHKKEDITIKVPKEIMGTYTLGGSNDAPKITLQLQAKHSLQACVTKYWFITACIKLEAIVMTPNSIYFDFDRDSYNATYTY